MYSALQGQTHTIAARNSILLEGFNTDWPKDKNHRISLMKIGFGINVIKK